MSERPRPPRPERQAILMPIVRLEDGPTALFPTIKTDDNGAERRPSLDAKAPRHQDSQRVNDCREVIRGLEEELKTNKSEIIALQKKLGFRVGASVDADLLVGTKSFEMIAAYINDSENITKQPELVQEHRTLLDLLAERQELLVQKIQLGMTLTNLVVHNNK